MEVGSRGMITALTGGGGRVESEGAPQACTEVRPRDDPARWWPLVSERKRPRKGTRLADIFILDFQLPEPLEVNPCCESHTWRGIL